MDRDNHCSSLIQSASCGVRLLSKSTIDKFRAEALLLAPYTVPDFRTYGAVEDTDAVVTCSSF